MTSISSSSSSQHTLIGNSVSESSHCFFPYGDEQERQITRYVGFWKTVKSQGSNIKFNFNVGMNWSNNELGYFYHILATTFRKGEEFDSWRKLELSGLERSSKNQ